jgi:ferritin
MIKKVTLNYFMDRFRAFDRYDNFGYEGLKALFEYIEQYEDETGKQIELDVTALCCDYKKYDSLEEFNQEYGEEFESLDEVRDKTDVIEIEGSNAFIIQRY